MEKHSMRKLLQAGWVFYRMRWGKYGEIWKNGNGNWSKHEEGFKSRTALEKRLKQIIQEDPKALEE